jgi:ATP synthase protein I
MKQEYKAIGSFGTLGLEIVLSILFGAYAGYWLDNRFGTKPWLMALGFFFGLGAAGKAVQRSLKQMQKVTEQEEREKGNPAPRFEKRRRPAKKASDGAPAEPAKDDDDRPS